MGLCETNGTNILIDSSKFEYFDSFYGKRTITTSEGLIFYIYEAFVVRYDVNNKGSEIIDSATYPYELFDAGTEIVFKIAYDADPVFAIVSKEEDRYSSQKTDYILLVTYDHGPIGFSVYDVINKKIYPGFMARDIEYKLTLKGIEYRYNDNDSSDESEWKLFELREGYSIVESRSIKD